MLYTNRRLSFTCGFCDKYGEISLNITLIEM